MKDRRTHLAHKAEHTVDLETQAIVAVSLADANEGDTSSLPWSLLRAETNLSAVATDPRAQRKLHDRPLTEVVADKGYHSNEVLVDLTAQTFAAMSLSPIVDDAIGRTRKKPKPRCMRTDVASEARVASGCRNAGPNSSNGPSPTCMTPALCDARTCAVEATSPTAC